MMKPDSMETAGKFRPAVATYLNSIICHVFTFFPKNFRHIRAHAATNSDEQQLNWSHCRCTLAIGLHHKRVSAMTDADEKAVAAIKNSTLCFCHFGPSRVVSSYLYGSHAHDQLP